MSKKNQYVAPTQSGWGVRSENSQRLTVKTETKSETLKIATNMGKDFRSTFRIYIFYIKT